MARQVFLPLLLLGFLQAPTKSLGQETMGLNLYQSNISDVLAGDCRSFPSCSAYAREAIHAYGPLRGGVLTADRLIRCGNDHTLDQVMVDGSWFAYDPVLLNPSIKAQVPFFSSDSCFSQAVLAQLRQLNGLPDPSLAVSHLHGMLLSSRGTCRLALNVELSKAFRNMGMPSAHLDTLATQQRQGHAPSSRELAKVYLSMGNVDQARLLVPSTTDDCLGLAVEAMSVESLEAIESMAQPMRLFAPDEFDAWKRTMTKRPWLAGTLGVVPGLGYLYAGQPESALSSALLTSVFILAATEAWSHGLPVIGGLASTFGISFCVGSIAGPIRSVKRQRQSSRQKLINSLVLQDDLLHVDVH